MHANVREHGLVGSTSPRNVGRAMLPPQDVAQPSVTALGIRYDSRRAPSSSESVAFSRFQYIPSRHQAFLILGNGGSSVRVSDVTVLDELKHVLNLSTGANSSVGAGHIVNALIIPPSSPDDKLCLALLFITPDRDDPWQLLSYSPTDQTIGNRIHLPSSQYETTSLEASEDLIALASIRPPTIRLFSTHSFDTVLTLPLTTPSPLFALSSRLLAIPSGPPSTHQLGRHSFSPIHKRRSSSNTLSGQIQIGVATTARRVSESVWDGFKSLISGSSSPDPAASPFSGSPDAQHSPYNVSRSAPSSHGFPASLTDGLLNMGGWSPPSTGSRRNSGGSATAERIVSPHSDGWIKILDLSPLLAVTSLEPAQPVLLSHFPISLPSSQPTIPTSTNPGTSPFTTISALSFSPSGTLLAASDQDGCVLRVFSVRGPIPSTIEAPSSRRSSASSASRRRTSFRSSRQSEEHAATSGPVPSPVWHTYDLVRGVTRGTIESVVWGLDSRWVGFVSGRGTFHLFPINPYGGPPDEESHLEGRVRNVPELQPLSTSLQSIARIRPSRIHHQQQTQQHNGIIAFIPPSISLSSSILNPDASHPLQSSFQDIVMFSPSSRSLSLRRCEISLKPVVRRDYLSRTGISISAPVSGLTNMMTGGGGEGNAGGLKVEEKTVYDRVLENESVKLAANRDAAWGPEPKQKSIARSDWLAQAELSTGSLSRKMLPAPVYLSHQFTFHSLSADSDWHALLHRSVFDIPCTKLEVRKEVRALSGSTTSGGESFVQGHSHPVRSTFDEPLASAIHASLETKPNQPPLIPMYPNAWKSSPNTWMDKAVPIKNVVVDMGTEGISLLKREIGKVNKARARKGGDRLIFEDHDTVFAEEGEDEEEDEAVAVTGKSGRRGRSRESQASENYPSLTSSQSGSGSTPSRPEEEQWDAWGEAEEYNKAKEEDSKFDDLGIGIVGEMDEEYATRGVIKK